MGKRMLGGLLLVVCLLGLGGCVFGSVDEMYALPKSSEAYVNLQAKINEEKGTGEYIAPLNGENRRPSNWWMWTRTASRRPWPFSGTRTRTPLCAS